MISKTIGSRLASFLRYSQRIWMQARHEAENDRVLRSLGDREASAEDLVQAVPWPLLRDILPRMEAEGLIVGRALDGRNDPRSRLYRRVPR